MAQGTWAKAADRVLSRVMRELPPDADEAAVDKAIRDAYPFGERSHHPYKVWLARARAWKADRIKLQRWSGGR